MIKREIKRIISFTGYIGIGCIISLSITFLMKGLTYIGFPKNIVAIIAGWSILVIPISAFIWIVQDIKLCIKTFPNTTLC